MPGSSNYQQVPVDVSILIVVFNKVEYTRQCLETLYQNTGDRHSFEVIVADNASSDRTAAFLQRAQRQYPNLKVVTNAENLGFVGGNNVAAQHARGRYVCFLNNDTEVMPGWLDPVVDLLDADESVGGVGSKLLYPDGQLQEAGGIIFRDASGWNYGRFDHPNDPEYNFVRDVDYCSGAALTVRADLFRELGGFDERYAPAYYEDADLCFGIRSLGRRVVYHHESEVVHHEGITSGTDVNSGFKRYQVINQPKFVEKWAAALAEQPERGDGRQYVRSICDRRSRGGRQVLMGSVEMQQHDRQGGAFRFINMLKLLLEAGHHVTYFAQNTRWREPNVDLEPYVHELRRMGAMVCRLDMDLKGNRIDPHLNQLDSVLGERRYEVALLFGGAESQAAVHVIGHASPWTRIVVDSVDLGYLREGRALAKGHVPRLWSDYEARKWMELGAYKHADAVLAVTPREQKVIDQEFEPGKSFYVPDLFPIPAQVPGYSERSGVVFLAGFRHTPNVDAARLLLDQIMPQVWRERPDVVLTIVGDSPPDWLRERANERTVVTGYVPDLQPYLQSARVAVAPITWGAGIKGKICQAMAAGAANVTTNVGAEGMELTSGVEALIADSPEAFAQAVICLHEDRELWERVMDGGRTWVSSRHAKPVVADHLLKAMFPESGRDTEKREGRSFDLASEGYQALRDRRFDTGEAVFRALVARDPEFAEGHLGLGRALAAKQRYEEAVAAMRRALELTDNPLAVLISLADPMCQAGRAAEAAALLESGLDKADPDHEHYMAAREVLNNVRNSVTPSYVSWYKRHALTAAERTASAQVMETWSDSSSIHLFVPCRQDQQVALADTLDSLGGQLCDRWALTVVGNGPAPDPLFEQLETLAWIAVEGAPEDAVSALVSRSMADWVGVLQPGDRLHPKAVFECLARSRVHPDWRLLYTDEDVVRAHDVHSEPRFKPDFNLELLRSMPYMGGLWLIRRDTLAGLGKTGSRPAVWNTELAFRVCEQFGDGAIGHVPDVLLHRSEAHEADAGLDAAFGACVEEHLARAGVPAMLQPGLAPGTHYIDYATGEWPLVSIIVPTRDQRALLEPCIEGLLQRTSYPNFEVLVVDNGSREPDALQYLESLPGRDARVRVLSFPHDYNFSAMNNLAAREARGDYLLLLNNDTVVVQDNWLERMVAQGRRPDVGVVGCRLVYPDQRLQHAGIVLGMGANGVAEHLFMGMPMTESGYLGRAQVAQEFSAVTGACLLVRKSLYDSVGGLDEKHLAVLYNDVDLCLKIRQAGYRIIWTPFATLIHHCGASLNNGHYDDPKRMEAARREMGVMLERWLPLLAHDPAYNRNLSLMNNDASCDVEISVGWEGSPTAGPRIMGLAFGSDGSAEHRVNLPLRSVDRHGAGRVALLPKYRDRVRVPSVAELQREKPDAFLIHNALHDVHLEAMESYRRFTDVPLVFGQDDLMIELPQYNEFRDKIYPDIKQRLRRAMRACHRLVVSTEPLAEAYRGWAEDIRVVPNYLDAAVWGGLESRRRDGRKPRVGWAGAQQHTGDLEIIFDVVKETADEIQWVFFGLCFEEWLPYGMEVHHPVDFDDYPEALAGLNLDLAVAPLAHNRFNQCKSNLKLLEYGALGIPVVCTDIDPYRNAPVTRVNNTPQAWRQAILERAHDLDAAAREGDRLQAWVREHWLLDDHLSQWLEALTSPQRTGLPKAAGERR